MYITVNVSIHLLYTFVIKGLLEDSLLYNAQIIINIHFKIHR